MRQYAGLWFPDDGTLTKALRARLDEQETYRGDRLAEALDQVRDFSCAVECGAHVGSWTLVLAQRFKQVIAFEPERSNFECLKLNVAGRDNVALYGVAVGAQSGSTFMQSRKTKMGSQISKDGAEVPLVTVDNMDIEQCGYLKLHVNGFELPVLRGAVETIKRCKPVMTVVFKPKLQDYGYTADEMLAFITKLGYRPGRGQDPYKVFVPS